MSTTATDADALPEPIDNPGTDPDTPSQTPRPEEERRVGDIDDLPRPVSLQYE